MSALEELGFEQITEDVILRPMLTIADAIDLFDGDCARRGLTNKTRATYRGTLGKLEASFPPHWDVAKVTPLDLERFLERRTRGLSNGSRVYTERCLSTFFKYLTRTDKVRRNPMDKLERTRRLSSDALDVTTVSSAEVARLFEAAETWAERLCIALLAYLGPRRHAAALLKLRDYDQSRGRLRFYEKGSKVIWKPIPDELRDLIDAAIAAGVYEIGAGLPSLTGECGRLDPARLAPGPESYLIPPEGPLQKEPRDDRCVYRIVKKLGDKAGVQVHTHSLRAAFAVFYLETGGNDDALQDLMGHASADTTRAYKRRLNRERRMESVRGLSWHQVSAGSGFGESSVMGAGGFEPPQPEPHGGKRDASRLIEDLLSSSGPGTRPVHGASAVPGPDVVLGTEAKP